MEQIIVTIDKLTGAVSYIVKGVKGKSCKKLTAFIDGLGSVDSCKLTPEYQQSEETGKNYNSNGQ
jgi:hypothetical protein